MKVRNFKNNLTKQVGVGLIGLSMSLGANAMDSHQGKEQAQNSGQTAIGDVGCQLAETQAKIICESKPEVCQDAQEKAKEVCDNSQGTGLQTGVSQASDQSQGKAVKSSKETKVLIPVSQASDQSQGKAVKSSKETKVLIPVSQASDQSQGKAVKSSKETKVLTPVSQASDQSQGKAVKPSKELKGELPQPSFDQGQGFTQKTGKELKGEVPQPSFDQGQGFTQKTGKELKGPVPQLSFDQGQGQISKTSDCKTDVPSKIVDQSQGQIGKCSKIEEIVLVPHVYDVADFSRFVKRSELTVLSKKQLRKVMGDGHCASNFSLQGVKIGKKASVKSKGVKHWNKTHFDHFTMEGVNGHSMDAHGAVWTNFVIAGELSDWEFQHATLENGWFVGHLKNLNFYKAKLTNISFWGSVLDATHNFLKSGKGIDLREAHLRGVNFGGSVMKYFSFQGAKIYPDTKFESANLDYNHLIGAHFIDCHDKTHTVSWQMAQNLNTICDTKYRQTHVMISGDQILQAMQQY